MRQLLILCTVAAIVGFVPHIAFAVFTSDVDVSAANPGDVVVVSVDSDTQEQAINAVESSLVFQSEELEFISSDDSDSVIGQWIQAPHLVATGTVHFSGVTPGGFVSGDARITKLSFKVLKPGIIGVSVVDPQLLLNDGQGTMVATTERSLMVEVVNQEVTGVVDDVELPEDFTPEIISDPDLFEGKSVLVFSTRDTGSGIARYEVKEGEFGAYVEVVSPYVIQYQALDTVLYVKAIDHSGNERVKVLYPKNWKPWYKPPKVITMVLVPSVLLLLIGLLWYLRTRRR